MKRAAKQAEAGEDFPADFAVRQPAHKLLTTLV